MDHTNGFKDGYRYLWTWICDISIRYLYLCQTNGWDPFFRAMAFKDLPVTENADDGPITEFQYTFMFINHRLGAITCKNPQKNTSLLGYIRDSPYVTILPIGSMYAIYGNIYH